MDYNITYRESTESFLGRVRCDNPTSGERLQNSWLPEFDEDILEEAERLNAILPLIKWCADNDKMTDMLKGELRLYYKDYTEGKLDGILAEYEAEEVIADLVASYKKVFEKDLD